MALAFPSSPTVGQTYTAGSRTWRWNGSVWQAVSEPPAAHASTHAAGGSDPLTPAQIGAATAAQGAKADSASQPGHTHAIGDVSGLQDQLNSNWAEVVSFPEFEVAGNNVDCNGLYLKESGISYTKGDFTLQLGFYVNELEGGAYEQVSYWWISSSGTEIVRSEEIITSLPALNNDYYYLNLYSWPNGGGVGALTFLDIARRFTSQVSPGSISAAQVVNFLPTTIGPSGSAWTPVDANDLAFGVSDLYYLLGLHESSINNPHQVTAEQVGAAPLTDGKIPGQYLPPNYGHAVQSDFASPYNYIGRAATGTSLSATTWKISRIQIANDGSATTLNATGAWTNRASLSYS